MIPFCTINIYVSPSLTLCKVCIRVFRGFNEIFLFLPYGDLTRCALLCGVHRSEWSLADHHNLGFSNVFLEYYFKCKNKYSNDIACKIIIWMRHHFFARVMLHCWWQLVCSYYRIRKSDISLYENFTRNIIRVFIFTFKIIF